VRGTDVVVRGFEFPALPPEEIAGAVALEASQICPFGNADSTLDFQVTSSDDKNTRGFWVAANNTLVRDTRQLVHEAGLHCTLVDVAGLALLNLLAEWRVSSTEFEVSGLRCNAASESSGRHTSHFTLAAPSLQTSDSPILLDLGGSCATLAAADHAGRPFVRDIGLGGAGILTRVAAEARMPFETVKAVLLEEEQVEEKDDELLQSCLEGACAGLIEDVGATLRYYAAQNNGMRIERVLVCGGFATMKGLVELLTAKLYIEAELWHPLSQWSCEMGETWEPLLRRHGPGLAVAAGLALRRL
jgi:type IV pilus assembly protein PilM